MYRESKKVVVTLDAGGTNFVFGAMRGCEYMCEPIAKPSCSDNLDRCLATLVEGFREIIERVGESPVAISFAFPGPADYPNGVIGGNLPNFPSFRDGVALGAYLEEQFGVPVFINNDGNLFAYGEAFAGALPMVNDMFKGVGSSRRYHNLIGLTFGTGFGCGAVVGGELILGDNASGGDIWCFRNKMHPEYIVEESVSIRAVTRVYRELSGDDEVLTPLDIFNIVEGLREGDKEAARESFARMGRCAGDALAMAATIVDGIVVIGGGLTGASRYIIPPMIEEMNSHLSMVSGESFPRMQVEVFDLDCAESQANFLKDCSTKIKVYGSERYVDYNSSKRIGVMTSKLGASKAISIGAYIYAINHLKN